jgi:tetrahydromethanopterin S-methyltransferase subunit D
LELAENMKSIIGILGAFVMAIGGAFMFYFLYKLTTNYFQDLLPSPEPLVAVLGFISFFFLGLGLLLIIQSGKKD